MSEFKGTPWPWKFEEYMDATSEKSVRVVGSNGDVVCDNESYYPAAVDPEDAKLIAAAPEVLEAASMALSVMEVEYTTNNRTDLAQFMEPLRAAIAKALGEDK